MSTSTATKVVALFHSISLLLFLSFCQPDRQPEGGSFSFRHQLASYGSLYHIDSADFNGDHCTDYLVQVGDSASPANHRRLLLFLCPTDSLYTSFLSLGTFCVDSLVFLPDYSSGKSIILVVERCADHALDGSRIFGIRLLSNQPDTVWDVFGQPLFLTRNNRIAVLALQRPWQFTSIEAEMLPALYSPMPVDTILWKDSAISNDDAEESILQQMEHACVVARNTLEETATEDAVLLSVAAHEYTRMCTSLLLTYWKFGRVHKLDSFIRHNERFWSNLPDEDRDVLAIVLEELKILQQKSRKNNAL